MTIRRPFGELDLGWQTRSKGKRTKRKGLIDVPGKTKANVKVAVVGVEPFPSR
jgi:hypothetical protein